VSQRVAAGAHGCAKVVGLKSLRGSFKLDHGGGHGVRGAGRRLGFRRVRGQVPTGGAAEMRRDSPHTATCSGTRKSERMAFGEDRLVRQFQRRLQPAAGGEAHAPTFGPRCIAELVARVERLHGVGEHLSHVKLSRYVVDESMTVPACVRGCVVATER